MICRGPLCLLLRSHLAKVAVLYGGAVRSSPPRRFETSEDRRATTSTSGGLLRRLALPNVARGDGEHGIFQEPVERLIVHELLE